MKRENKILPQGERETGIACATMSESEGTRPRVTWPDGSTYRDRITEAKGETGNRQEEGKGAVMKMGNETVRGRCCRSRTDELDTTCHDADGTRSWSEVALGADRELGMMRRVVQ